MQLREILEQRRMRALLARNPLEYFEYCVASDVYHTENPLLFHEGAILFDMKRGDFSGAAGLSREARYVLLRNAARDLSSSIDKQSEDKMNLLVNLFPRRFGREGKQRIDGYSDSQIGKLFNEVVDYAKKFDYDFSK